MLIVLKQNDVVMLLDIIQPFLSCLHFFILHIYDSYEITNRVIKSSEDNLEYCFTFLKFVYNIYE